MKFGVITFPGSNCDHDMLYQFERVMEREAIPLWHKDTSLDQFELTDCIVLPGGFSYGDYMRCGAIARFSPIMQAVTAFAAEGGLVYGICNGFQILCESHLLPGVLLRNTNQKYICRNVYLKPGTNDTAITGRLDMDRAYKIPIAHAEGRFHAAPDVLQSIIDNDQVIFRYCDADGQVTAEANPNGTAHNIAGICNAGRNVFGMMPHPERASEKDLGNTDGYDIFASLISEVESGGYVPKALNATAL